VIVEDSEGAVVQTLAQACFSVNFCSADVFLLNF
jgi:hypothetical protein